MADRAGKSIFPSWDFKQISSILQETDVKSLRKNKKSYSGGVGSVCKNPVRFILDPIAY